VLIHVQRHALFCHIPAAGFCAGLLIPDLQVSFALQVSLTAAQLASSPMPTDAAPLENKPVQMKM
jgi:hypothetical protein